MLVGEMVGLSIHLRTSITGPKETVFKYKKGTDSVLIVSKEDYDKCNTINPIKRMDEDGDSASLKIDRSGPFYFISGNPGSCEKGQKLFIVVMSVRPSVPDHKSPPPTPDQAALTPQPSVSPPGHDDVNAPAPSSSPAAASLLSSKYSIALVLPVSLLASWPLLWLH
ncbi:Plastocyanin-like [Macleaya cordata]|uniref:Plastocyanin-like n=1 Tax=Macleaya cordata TaxID=56857 RepID=A0A200QWR9_MACCD|nr:Plastocyanin-like [Macleaya cordata]